jgi:hypothetical protein
VELNFAPAPGEVCCAQKQHAERHQDKQLDL